jgi:hypothetical protein
MIVRCGSIATEPLGDGAIQCLLFPASEQIADRSRMTQRAKKRHMHCSKVGLFDHLVGKKQEGFRNCEPKRFSGL